MSMIKSAFTVGGFTMLSRVFGFVRDVLIAALLGTGPVAEAFVIAFRIPNLFRRLFGEGAFNAAFVPLFAKKLEGGHDDAPRRFASEAFAGLGFVLLVFSAVAELAMPLLVYVQAPGFAATPSKFDLTIDMARIAFPYLAFMSLTAMLGGVLNSFGRFAAAAAAPVLLNIIMISALGYLALAGWGNTSATGRAMVWAVSFAGAAQLLMLWIAVRQTGFHLKITRPRLSDDMRRLIALGIPGVIAGGIAQLNLVISTAFASLQEGAAPWLYFADRVYQLPLGVIGVAVGVVLLPELSRLLRAGDMEAAFANQNRALEFSMLLTVPAAIALMAMPRPIVQVLFERGAFTGADTTASALALSAFAAGLPAFVMIKIFSPGFFAREDTKTPMIFAGISVAVNIIGAFALFYWIGFVGIAVAASIAGWVNAFLLAVTLGGRKGFESDRRLRRNMAVILMASLAMGAVLLVVNNQVAGLFTNETLLAVRLVVLVGIVVLGAGIYFALCHVTGVFRWADFVAAFRRKPKT